MRFLDANVFVYAYYRPQRELGKEEREMKESAKGILSRINEGEERGITTVVHLSEMANILKRGMTANDLSGLIVGLIMADNVEVEGVTRDLYFSAAELGRELELDPNDALAVEAMTRSQIKEIYTFDTDFDRVKTIARITQ